MRSVLVLVPLLTFFQVPAPHSSSVTLQGNDLPVSRFLGELRRQSGVGVEDLRSDRKKPAMVSLDLREVTFWQALDTIAARTGSRVQTGREGGLTLTTAPEGFRQPPTSYDRAFRSRLVRVTATRDLEGESTTTTFGVEVAWMPTVFPLFLDSQAQKVRVLNSRKESMTVVSEGGTLTPVDGRSSLVVEVAVSDLPRSEPRVALVEGMINAVVPSKMLTYRFEADLAGLRDAVADGAVRRLVQDEVVCRVDRVILDGDRWSVQMGLNYPLGSKSLESFQASSLVVNNELRLISADGKQVLTPSSNLIEFVSSRRAQVTYHFTDRPGRKRGNPRDWKVEYRAPARIIETLVRFRFQDVPLP